MGVYGVCQLTELSRFLLKISKLYVETKVLTSNQPVILSFTLRLVCLVVFLSLT